MVVLEIYTRLNKLLKIIIKNNMIIICWLKEFWRTITSSVSISGHDFVEIEKHENCKVYVCECKKCGKIDISWSKNNL